MISKEALEIKSKLEKDYPGKDILKSRLEWVSHARTITYSNRSTFHEEYIDGIRCLRVNKDQFKNGKVIFYVHGGGMSGLYLDILKSLQRQLS